MNNIACAVLDFTTAVWDYNCYRVLFIVDHIIDCVVPPLKMIHNGSKQVSGIVL